MKTFKRNKRVNGKMKKIMKRTKQKGGWPSLPSFFSRKNNANLTPKTDANISPKADHSDIVALIDVDDTLIKGGNDTLGYNDNLIQFLVNNNITRIYLFTMMHLNIGHIYERNNLVVYLQQKGITVLGIITPNDILWTFNEYKDINLNEIGNILLDYQNNKSNILNEKTVIKTLNDNYDDILTSSTLGDGYNTSKQGYIDLNIPDISTYINNPANLYTAYPDAQNDAQNFDKTTLSKSYNKVYLNRLLSLIKKYPHEKGVMMDLFLKYKPPWVHSILVIDDNADVIKTILQIAEREKTNIIITPIFIPTKINQDANINEIIYSDDYYKPINLNKPKNTTTFDDFPKEYYENYLNKHLEKVNELNEIKYPIDKNPLNVNRTSLNELNKVTAENNTMIAKIRAQHPYHPVQSDNSSTKKWSWWGGKNRTKKNRRRSKKLQKNRRRNRNKTRRGGGPFANFLRPPYSRDVLLQKLKIQLENTDIDNLLKLSRNKQDIFINNLNEISKYNESASKQQQITNILNMLNPPFKILSKQHLTGAIQPMVSNVIQGQSNYLTGICSNSGFCMTFGIEDNKIKRFFEGFTNFTWAFNHIKLIGEPSANGFVNQIEYDRSGYKAFAVLKSSNSPESDNLMYEYRVGQYINTLTKIFPCFVETYGLFKYKTGPLPLTFYNAMQTTPTPENPTPDPAKTVQNLKSNMTLIPGIDWNLACEQSDKLALLIQHFDNVQTFYNWYVSNTRYLDLNICKSIIYQIYIPLGLLKDKFTHNDLHMRNVLLYSPPNGKLIKFTYKIDDVTIEFDSPFIVKLIDYSRSYFKDDDLVDGKNVYTEMCNKPSCIDCGKEQGFHFNKPIDNVSVISASTYSNNVDIIYDPSIMTLIMKIFGELNEKLFTLTTNKNIINYCKNNNNRDGNRANIKYCKQITIPILLQLIITDYKSIPIPQIQINDTFVGTIEVFGNAPMKFTPFNSSNPTEETSYPPLIVNATDAENETFNPLNQIAKQEDRPRYFEME